MLTSTLVKFLFLSTWYLLCRCDGDTIYLLIDNTKVTPCSGVEEQGDVKTEDIQILDKNGVIALYLECPNDYTVSVKNIKVKKRVPNLACDIAATLSVPLVQGSIISFDVPVQVYPQRKLLEGTLCDNSSGVITDPNARKEYCHYCNICETGTQAENRADRDNKLKLGKKDPSNNIENKCSHAGEETTYGINQRVHAPGKKEIEEQVNGNKGQVDKALLQKLEQGKGKLTVNVQCFSSDTPPLPASEWYPKNRGCECCTKDDIGSSQCKAGFFASLTGLGSTNPCPKCNNNYVAVCNKGTQTKVSCYQIDFNYRVTNKSSDVDEFKRATDYNNKVKSKNYAEVSSKSGGSREKSAALTAGTGTSGAASTNTGSATGGGTSSNVGTAGQSTGSGSNGIKKCVDCSKQACLEKILFPPTKGYCNSYWETPNARGYCCSKCPAICQA